LIIKPLFDEVLHEILHALAFNTLLSSQETDAFSGVRSFFVVPLVFHLLCSLSNRWDLTSKQIPYRRKPQKTYRAIMGVSNQPNFPVVLRPHPRRSLKGLTLGPVRLRRRPARSRGEHKD
ncbi:hypothetical protein, partial [Nonomuraea typhae]|uniref:hypothetical protein n=1 Tax=Nonomuraea typhae TaxID=2603600 RepID=UPI001CA569BE